MRKVLVIAARDYRAAVKTKSFIISLLLMPIMMGGSIAVQVLLKDKVDISDKHFAVIDRTGGALGKALLVAADRRNSLEQKEIYDANQRQLKPKFLLEMVSAEGQTTGELRYGLSERVRKQELFGFLEIGPEVAGPGVAVSSRDNNQKNSAELKPPADDKGAVRYQSNSPTYDAFQSWAQAILDQEVQRRRLDAAHVNLTQDELKELLRPVSLLSKGLSNREGDAADENRIASFGVPLGMIMLMFMLVLLGATPLMQGVVEEKMQRIAEVLLGSVRPFELMMGKLIGMVGVSLTLAAVYLGGAYWAAVRYNFAEFIPTGLLMWFFAYQVLAVLMFGSLFIAIGASCTDMRETQAMTWPVMLLICIPMFVWFQVVREPNSPFALGISLFPFATPMLMLGRQAVPPGIPIWQPILGVCLVLTTTVVCVYAAGRIFRVGILMQGKGANLGQVMKWVFRG